MSRLTDIRAQSKWSDIFEGQTQHFGIALLMTVGACSLLEPSESQILGLTAMGWAQWLIGLALVHQFLVAVVFRLQLHRNLISKLFGEVDMRIWAAVFLPLLAARPITLILIGLADSEPILSNPLPIQILGWMLVIPAVWALYSTLVFFTLPRALGGDHFRDEIAKMPLVDRGFSNTRPTECMVLRSLGCGQLH